MLVARYGEVSTVALCGDGGMQAKESSARFTATNIARELGSFGQ